MLVSREDEKKKNGGSSKKPTVNQKRIDAMNEGYANRNKTQTQKTQNTNRQYDISSRNDFQKGNDYTSVKQRNNQRLNVEETVWDQYEKDLTKQYRNNEIRDDDKKLYDLWRHKAEENKDESLADKLDDTYKQEYDKWLIDQERQKFFDKNDQTRAADRAKKLTEEYDSEFKSDSDRQRILSTDYESKISDYEKRIKELNDYISETTTQVDNGFLSPDALNSEDFIKAQSDLRKLNQEYGTAREEADQQNNYFENTYYSTLLENGTEKEKKQAAGVINSYDDDPWERIGKGTEANVKSLGQTALALYDTAKDVLYERSAEGLVYDAEQKLASGEYSQEQYDKLMDKAKEVKNFQANDPANLSQQLREEIDYMNREVAYGTEGVEKFAIDSINGTTNFLMQYALLGEVGSLLSMSAMSGTQKYYQLLDEGYDADTAFLNASATALVSYMTEKIGMDHFVSVLNGTANQSFFGQIINSLSKSGIANYYIQSVASGAMAEGLEEGVEGLADPIVDWLTLGTPIEYNGGEIFYAMLVGAGSGALMSGMASVRGANFVLNTKQQYNQLKADLNTAREIRNNPDITPGQARVIDKLIAKAELSLNNFEEMAPLSMSVNSVEDAADVSTKSDGDEALAKAVYPNARNIAETSQRINQLSQRIDAISQEFLRNNNVDVDINDFMDTTKEDRKQILEAADYATKLNVEVTFQSDESIKEQLAESMRRKGKSEADIRAAITNPNLFVDGYVKDGKIVLNMTSHEGQLSTLVHELTHKTENSEHYNELHRLVQEYLGNDNYNERLSQIRAMYDGVADDPEHELVAKVTQDALLLGNREFLDNLVRYHESLAYRLFKGIQSMTTKDSKVKMENAFMEAFRDAGKNAENELAFELSYDGVHNIITEEDGNYNLENDLLKEGNRESRSELNKVIGNIKKGNKPEGNVLIYQHPTQLMLDLGAEDHPIIISPNELAKGLLSAEEAARLGYDVGKMGSLHELGEDGINKAIDNLSDPVFVLKGKNKNNEDKLTFFSDTFDKHNKQVIVPIDINAESILAKERDIYNVVMSFHGRKSINNFIRNQKRDFGAFVAYKNIKKIQTIMDSGKVQYQNSDLSVSKFSITDSSFEVKNEPLINDITSFTENYLKDMDFNDDLEYGSYREQTIESLQDNPQALIETLEDFISDRGEDFPDGAKEAERLIERINSLMSLSEANDASEEVQDKVIVDGTEGSAAPQFSLSTWNATDKEAVKRDLVNKLGVSEEKADKWIADVNGVAKMIADDRVRLDYEPNSRYSAMKSNDEYVASMDMSTLCKKREILQGTIDEIQNRLPNYDINGEEYTKIRQMMKDKGYEVACGFCYVESRRKELGKVAKSFIDQRNYNGLTIRDLTTVSGVNELQRNYPEIYEDFVKFNNKRGSGKVNLVESRTEYRGEIMKLTKSQIEKITRIGGLRLQSYSDFETPHMIDMMQIVVDMSRRGLTSQAYTKIPNFADAFGDTGIKINESLVCKGVDENGNLIFDDVEGMPHEKAFEIRDRHPENVGTILVGKDDATILAAMADDRIDFIIPFHRSGWGQAEYERLGITGYQDYTSQQKEYWLHPEDHRKSNGKTESAPSDQFYPIDYWDYSKTGKENAETYLRLCAEEKRIPKFSNFLVNNGDGSWSLQPDGSTDGYWKMLIDFKMYDNDGVGAPQQIVQPIFNNAVNEQIMREYGGEHRINRFASDVVEEFVKEHQTYDQDNDIKFSLGMGNGYDGYSMSNNARNAYEDGRKPISQFDSYDLENFNDSLEEMGIETKVKSVAALKRLLQDHGSTGEWHHTSSYYNQTDFYDPNSILEKLSDGDLSEDIIREANEYKAPKKETKTYHGDFHYLEWGGTRKHPKATERTLTDVDIEERGSFYYVYDKNGNELVRKKIGSNGTSIDDYQARDLRKQKLLNLQEEQRNYEQERYDNGDPGFKDFMDSLKNRFDYEESMSGNIYPRGKKPSPYDYEIGLDRFYTPGDRIYRNTPEGYRTFEWNGTDFEQVNFNKGNAKFSLGEYDSSKSVKQNYDRAVQNNDRELAEQCVERAAKKWGAYLDENGKVVNLYHGTDAFGFTAFDLQRMDDGRSIFLTNKIDTAKTYSGSENLQDIGKYSPVNPNDVLNELNNYFGDEYNEWSYISSEEVPDYIESLTADLQDFVDDFYGEMYRRGNYRDAELQEFLSGANGLLDLTDRIISASYDKGKEWIKSLERFDQAEYQHSLLSSLQPTQFNDPKKEGIYLNRFRVPFSSVTGLETYAPRQAAWKLHTVGQDQFYNMGDRGDKRAIYSLYAKLENPLVIDANRDNWSTIRLPESIIDDYNDFILTPEDRARKEKLGDSVKWGKFEVSNTRRLSEYAQDRGYDGVIFKNLKDTGGEMNTKDPISDVYVVFNPNNVKSADPFTYDDNGDLIPLEERFNSKKNELRFSLGEVTDEKKKNLHPAIVRDFARKFEMDPDSDTISRVLVEAMETDSVSEETKDRLLKEYIEKVEKDTPNENAREAKNLYSALRNYTKKTKINIDSFMNTNLRDDKFSKGGYGEFADAKDWAQFRKNNFDKFTFVKNGGMDVDSFYQEFTSVFPGMVDEETVGGYGQLHAIANLMDNLKEQGKEPYRVGDEEYDQIESWMNQQIDDMLEDTRKHKEFLAESERLEVTQDELDRVIRQKGISDKTKDTIEREKRIFIDNAKEWIPDYDIVREKYDIFSDDTLNLSLYEALMYGDVSDETRATMERELLEHYGYSSPHFMQYAMDTIDAMVQDTLNYFVLDAKYKANKKFIDPAVTRANNVAKAYGESGKMDEEVEKQKEILETIKDAEKYKNSFSDRDLARDILDRGTDRNTYVWATMEQNLDYVANGDMDLRDALRARIEVPRSIAQMRRNAIRNDGQKVINQLKELGITGGSEESKIAQFWKEKHTNEKIQGVKPWKPYTQEQFEKDTNYKMKNGKTAKENIEKAVDIIDNEFRRLILELNASQFRVYGDVLGENEYETAKLKAKLETSAKLVSQLKQDMIANPSLNKQAAYNKAVKEYNQLINQFNVKVKNDLSHDSTRRQFTPIRANYVHHWRKGGFISDLKNFGKNPSTVPTALSGLTENVKPNTASAGIMWQQGGGDYDADIVESFADYVAQVSALIADNDLIVDIRQLAKDIRAEATKSEMSNFVAYLDEYANNLAGKRRAIDRAIDTASPTAGKMLRDANRMGKRAALMFNASSALVQIANLPNGMGILARDGMIGNVDALKGMTDYVSSMTDTGKQSIIEQSPFISDRYFDFNTYNGSLGAKANRIADAMMTMLDEAGTKMIWWGGYEQALRKGKSGMDAILYADDIARRSVAGRSVGEVPLALTGQALNMIMPFQVETNNAWQTLKQNVKGKNGAALATTFIMSFLVNALLRYIKRDDALAEPLSPIINEMLGDDGLIESLQKGDDKAQAWENYLINVVRGEAGELLSAMPAGSILTSFSFGKDKADELFGDYNPSRYGTTNIGLKGAAEAIYDAFTGDLGKAVSDLVGGYVPGGKQLTKTVGGLQSEGVLPKYRYDTGEWEMSPVERNKKGKIKYVNDPSNVFDFMRATLFGKWATKPARDYIDSGFKVWSATKENMEKTADSIGLPTLGEKAEGQVTQESAQALKDWLKEQNKWNEYVDQIKSDYEKSDGSKTFAQFANTYGLTKKSLEEETKDDFYKSYYDTYKVSDKDKGTFQKAMDLDGVYKDSKGNVTDDRKTGSKKVANSEAIETRKALEDMGQYENVLEYIEQNGLNPSEFGLTNTVIGWDDEKFESKYNDMYGEKESEPTAKSSSRSGSSRRRSSTMNASTIQSILSKMRTQRFNNTLDLLDDLLKSSRSSRKM